MRNRELSNIIWSIQKQRELHLNLLYAFGETDNVDEDDLLEIIDIINTYKLLPCATSIIELKGITFIGKPLLEILLNECNLQQYETYTFYDFLIQDDEIYSALEQEYNLHYKDDNCDSFIIKFIFDTIKNYKILGFKYDW